QTNYVEGSNQIDVDHLGEGREAVRPAFAQELFRQPDARTNHGAVKTTEGFDGRVDSVLYARLVRDIDFEEAGPRSQLSGQALAAGTLKIGNNDVGARVRQHTHTGGTQS